MPKKMKTCVVCGFAASRGSSTDGRFVCSACDRERLDEEERRYAEQEEAESSRDYCRAVERY